jgi:hypothetical protein
MYHNDHDDNLKLKLSYELRGMNGHRRCITSNSDNHQLEMELKAVNKALQQDYLLTDSVRFGSLALKKKKTTST